MEDFLATVLPRPADTVGIRGQSSQTFFVPSKSCCAQKDLFQTYNKYKLFSP